MILTVCCNPCIDTYLYVEKLTPKSLNRVKESYSCIGGKGINVAKAITSLNGKAFATGIMGSEHNDLFVTELKKLGIHSRFTLYNGKTRTNYKVNDIDGQITELNEKGKELDSKTSDSFIDLLKELSIKSNFVVFSGSLPKGVDDKYYEKLANNITPPFAIDAEKAKLLPVLHLHPEIIKPNIHELEDMVNQKLSTKTDIVNACRQLISLGAKRVLASLGGDGAILVTKDEAYFASAPDVKVESTVGAGDTMLSSAVIEIIKNSKPQEILSSAVAAGTAAVMSKGTDPIDINNYNNLLTQIKVEKI